MKIRNQSYRQLIYVALLSISSILFVKCHNKKPSTNTNKDTTVETSSNTIGKEEFDAFYSKFIRDSVFQTGRIVFPLPGINTDEMEVEDTVYYWQKANWKMYEGIPSNVDTTEFKINKVRIDSIAVDEVALKDASFGVKYVFKLKKGKWYLARYENINL